MVMAGLEKKSLVIQAEEKKIIAYHGWACCDWLVFTLCRPTNEGMRRNGGG